MASAAGGGSDHQSSRWERLSNFGLGVGNGRTPSSPGSGSAGGGGGSSNGNNGSSKPQPALPARRERFPPRTRTTERRSLPTAGGPGSRRRGGSGGGGRGARRMPACPSCPGCPGTWAGGRAWRTGTTWGTGASPSPARRTGTIKTVTLRAAARVENAGGAWKALLSRTGVQGLPRSSGCARRWCSTCLGGEGLLRRAARSRGGWVHQTFCFVELSQVYTMLGRACDRWVELRGCKRGVV